MKKSGVTPLVDTVWCSLNDTFFFRIPGKNIWPTSSLIVSRFFCDCGAGSSGVLCKLVSRNCWSATSRTQSVRVVSGGQAETSAEEEIENQVICMTWRNTQKLKKKRLRLPHTSQFFCRTARFSRGQIALKVVGLSAYLTLAEAWGRVIQNQDGAFSTEVTLMTFPNWLRRAQGRQKIY